VYNLSITAVMELMYFIYFYRYGIIIVGNPKVLSKVRKLKVIF